MNLELTLSDRSRQALQAATRHARDQLRTELSSGDVLFGLLSDPCSVAGQILKTVELVSIEKCSPDSGHKEIIQFAQQRAESKERDTVHTDDLLWGILQQNGSAAQLLNDHHFDLGKFEKWSAKKPEPADLDQILGQISSVLYQQQQGQLSREDSLQRIQELAKGQQLV